VNYAKDTHVSVASFVCRLYKTEFRSTIGAGRAAKWYQYMKGKHVWKYLRTSTEVRSRLSDGVRQEYWIAERDLKNKKYQMKPEEVRAAQSDAQDDAVDGQIKKLAAIQRNLETTTFKDHVLKECQEKFFEDDFEGKLNMDAELVGCANGVLELRHYDNEDGTGRPRVLFRGGLPEDNISFLMGHCDNLEPLAYEPYDPANPTSQHLEILAFFERIYPDAVLREYVMTLYASCLEGVNREQRFYVNQGVGSNGKSMMELLMEKTFGDYCAAMQTTVFTRKRPDSGSANPDLIGVKGCRYIHMGEPDDNEKINTSIMKQFTGGDAVNARGLFADQEKFVIMGKIFMSCNDLPPINKVDNGTWRRVRVIPHNSIFKDPGDPSIDPSKHIYEKDLNLEGKLIKWRGAYFGILVWYFENHYLVHGLKEPACVLAASNKYKEENDAFMLFFTETYVKDTVATPITAKDVRSHFNTWKKTQPKTLELKVATVLERMKLECGNNSTDTQVWGIRIADYEDISGSNFLKPVDA
jgi:P4 family phage/plasmid primase-like protien